MTNIKVTYGSTSRRFSISSTTTWSEIETKFRNLFNIPKEIQMIVTYTDEDEDVITLSSDLELQEVLSNFSNNTIKFVLTTSNMRNISNVIDRERSIDTVIDDETSSLINGVSAIQIEDSNNKTTPKHVTTTEEVENLQYSSQETLGENSKSAAKSTNDNNVQEKNSSVEGNQGNDDELEIIVVITRNSWLHRRRERFGGCNPYYSYYTFGGRPRRGYHYGETHYNTSGRDRIASSRGHGCGRHHRRRQQISSEVVAEKISTLHSMGFVNDNLEELVKRHNGNLELIIEELLANQPNEQNDGRKSEEVMREEDDEKYQPMEVEEENRPYAL